MLGLLPGKPFSLDNFRSLGHRQRLYAKRLHAELGIEPQHMLAVLPTYLDGNTLEAQLDRYRRLNDLIVAIGTPRAPIRPPAAVL